MPAPTLLWLSRIACACDAVLWLSRYASRGFGSGGGGDDRSSSREKYTLTGFSTRDATRSRFGGVWRPPPVPGSARGPHASAG